MLEHLLHGGFDLGKGRSPFHFSQNVLALFDGLDGIGVVSRALDEQTSLGLSEFDDVLQSCLVVVSVVDCVG